ncbi:MAG: protein translocase subunit SecD [Ruminococcaceae bacterium]|nr:protein translocase subunit SecD [Oscillospiraceae bacterium]
MQKGCKTMKKSVTSFILLLLVIALLVVTAVYGVRIGDKGLKGIFDEGAVTLGLDLVGGSSITLEAVIPETENTDGTSDEPSVATSAMMDQVVAVLRNRVTAAGYTEAQVALVSSPTGGSNRVRVDIPNVDDPEVAARYLGTTAQLMFATLNEEEQMFDIILTGEQVKDATATLQANELGQQQYVVALQFDSSARASFADATERTSKTGEPIYILLDGAVISAPVASERIDSTECVISGNFDAASASELANLISSGNLPCDLQVVEKRAVGASLGAEAFERAMLAGLIGIILVMIFMIAVYRLPGLVASLALIAYIAITAICIVLFKVNLSLPGIAGIFLTIGMAVDANVVIFERIKEELNFGKSLKAAVKSGFNRAFTAVIDSNITTLIAAVVLWIYGTGAIQGFAITLFLGVVISLFTALLLTKSLLNAFVGLGVRNIKLFGAKSADENL